MEYKIVTVQGGTFKNPENALSKLEEEVNQLIKLGWKPQGGVHLISLPDLLITNIAIQAMVKE